MNKQTLIILLTNAKNGLVQTAGAVPEDKLSWRPLDNGRPILDLLGETAQATSMATELARTKGETKISPELFQQWKAERANWTREVALQKLEENTANLLSEIENLDEHDLAQDVLMPMRGGVTMPLAAWIMMSYRTMISRYAQINYIQTLYGDFDFH